MVTTGSIIALIVLPMVTGIYLFIELHAPSSPSGPNPTRRSPLRFTGGFAEEAQRIRLVEAICRAKGASIFGVPYDRRHRRPPYPGSHKACCLRATLLPKLGTG